MQQLVKRQIRKHIDQQKSKFPVIAVTGPRQSGKTTLLKNIFSDYNTFRLKTQMLGLLQPKTLMAF